MSAGTSLTVLYTVLLLQLSYVHTTEGSCKFDEAWQGRWFQSGVQSPLLINSTHIETKGECYEEEGDKFLVYDGSDRCYRCIVMHAKHPSVLQYKETFCEPKGTLSDICSIITGDAALYSLFRKHPEAQPVPCPFKNAPFTLTYNRGTGECASPPSRADSCTDDSRLVLKYQACADVPSTESHVEELVCLATWKEGSTRYLIGRISQGNRRSLTSDEDQYRCFVYQRSSERGRTVYYIAQSADATCNAVQNARDGSRIMVLTAVDDKHQRCRFLNWTTDHHTWLSLDRRRTYRFSQHNATLRILDEETPKPPRPKPQQHPSAFAFEEMGFESEDQKKNSEMRVVCHAILERLPDQVQIVAHVTSGCQSGYICMIFYRRDSNVIEIQQSPDIVENADDACANFDSTTAPFITLLTPNLHAKKCPHLGRYTVTKSHSNGEKRKKRQQPDPAVVNKAEPECLTQDFEALSVGCSGTHEMEFRHSCPQQIQSTYSCHGSWTEDGTTYVVASSNRKGLNEPPRYCFAYTPEPAVSLDGGAPVDPPILRLTRASDTCRRPANAGNMANAAAWVYNFTSNGTCADAEGASSSCLLLPAVLLVIVSIFCTLAFR